jgi:hypothetical protein
MILTNDHPPAHVHVIGADGRAKIELDCTAGSIELLWHHGISRADLRPILAETVSAIQSLCDKWRAIHGQV